MAEMGEDRVNSVDDNRVRAALGMLRQVADQRYVAASLHLREAQQSRNGKMLHHASYFDFGMLFAREHGGTPAMGARLLWRHRLYHGSLRAITGSLRAIAGLQILRVGAYFGSCLFVAHEHGRSVAPPSGS